MTDVHKFTMRLNHDNGSTLVTIGAESREAAITQVMKSGRCPRRAITEITTDSFPLLKEEAERYASLIPPPARVIEWQCAMDNYEPVPRRIAHGVAVAYVHRNLNYKGLWIPAGPIRGSDLEKSVIVTDDGKSVTPWWAGGYHRHPSSTYSDQENQDGFPYVLFHEFPLSQGIRPGTGRPADMSSWMLGPRKFYHLKVIS